jgi:hypothetical protein
MATICDTCSIECDFCCDECGGDYCEACLTDCPCGGSYCRDCRKQHYTAVEHNGIRLHELCKEISAQSKQS